jgi:hypothetical protein
MNLLSTAAMTAQQRRRAKMKLMNKIGKLLRWQPNLITAS